eukprot:363744-Chlamydomonas_euryale.AAC.9
MSPAHTYAANPARATTHAKHTTATTHRHIPHHQQNHNHTTTATTSISATKSPLPQPPSVAWPEFA